MVRSPADQQRPLPPSARVASHLPALALALFSGLAHFPAAGAGLVGDIGVQGRLLRIESDGSWSLQDVKLTHGRDTRVTADRAQGVEKPGGLTELELTGKVHIEFRDAVLDGESAFMVLRGEDLVSARVNGRQATFSHQPERAPRRINGRANGIDYTSSTGKVRFSGDSFFTDGRYTLEAPGSNTLTYDINDGSVSDDGDPDTRVRGTFRAGDELQRIPTPSTPDRGEAQ